MEAPEKVGIAVGSGTDVAAETADIILVNRNPRDITNLVAFGKATYRKMIQNLFWATGYNVVAILLAAGVLYPNFVLSPAIGAVSAGCPVSQPAFFTDWLFCTHLGTRTRVSRN